MLRPRGREASDELARAFVCDGPSVLPELELLHAGGGEEGCTVVRDGRERGRPVACAYVNVGMPPGINGIEAVRRMRRVDRDVEIDPHGAGTDNAVIGYRFLYPDASQEIENERMKREVKRLHRSSRPPTRSTASFARARRSDACAT